jgi:AsmA protein
MKKVNKPIKIIFIALVLILILSAVSLKMFLTPERVKDTLLAASSEHLGRDVLLGEIEVSVFSGITLSKFEILEKNSEASFLKVDKVILRYQLLPLLQKKLVIDNLCLVSPYIQIKRDKDGAFNFSDLLNSEPDTQPAEPDQPGQSEKNKATSSSMKLLIGSVVISDGQVMYNDLFSAGRELSFGVKNFSLEVSDIALDKEFPFSLKSKFNKADIFLSGVFNPQVQSGKIKLKLDNFNLLDFYPFFEDKLPGKLKAFMVDLDLSINKETDLISSSGNIIFRNIDLTLAALKDAPIKNAKVTLGYDLSSNINLSELKLKKIDLGVNKIPINASGVIKDLLSNPLAELSVRINSLAISELSGSLPGSLVKQVNEYKLDGKISLLLSLSGLLSSSEVLKEAKLELDNIQAEIAGYKPLVSGQLELKEKMLKSRLNLKVNGNIFEIQGDVKDIFKKPIQVSSKISSDRLDLDSLIVAGGNKSKGQASTAVPAEQNRKTSAVEIGPYDIPLNAKGDILFDFLIVNGLNISNLNCNYTLSENKLRINKLTGQIAEGKFFSDSKIDLGVKGLKYSLSADVDRVKIEQILDPLVPSVKGSMMGLVDFETSLSGRGTIISAIKQNLSGDGKILLSDTRVVGGNLVSGFSGLVNLQDLKILRFSKGQVGFSVFQGKVKINGDLSGKDLRVRPTGVIGLDGSLAIRADCTMSRDTTAKLDKNSSAKYVKYMVNQKGQLQLPVILSGNVSEPDLSIDTSIMKKKVKKAASKKAKSIINKYVGKELFKEEKNDKNKAGKESESKALKKLFKKKLKGLF